MSFLRDSANPAPKFEAGSEDGTIRPIPQGQDVVLNPLTNPINAPRRIAVPFR